MAAATPCTAFAWGWGLPAWAIMLAGTATAISVLAFRTHAANRARALVAREQAFLVIDDEGIFRERGTVRTPVLRWSETYGVTLFSDRSRSHLVFAFTTAEGARYVGANVTLAERSTHHVLIANAATLADHDLENSLAESESWLADEGAEALLDVLTQRDPACFARFFLSTTSGESVRVDEHRVSIGERTFSLHEPLSSRNAVFHESGGRVATIYHATVVAQGEHEVAFVAPMPADLSWGSARSRTALAPIRDALVRRALRRDSRLYAAEPEPPPARETRVAIDRLFMLPLRTMLDRAPRVVATQKREAPMPASVPTPGVTSRVS